MISSLFRLVREGSVSSLNKLLKDDTLSSRTSLNSDEIISLLHFVLSNNYFICDDKIYKQIHGCAMGSPVSPVVANLCMEAIEEVAINTSEIQPKIWKRYVDDSFCIIKRNAVNSFHTTLNSIDPHISFTIEEESDQQIAFLDTLVSRKDNKITINVYRKATHTDRYLDFSSHHDKRHKISTAETLLHRAINLPNTSQGKNTEINHVTDALSQQLSLLCCFQHLKAEIFQTARSCHSYAWRIGLHVF